MPIAMLGGMEVALLVPVLLLALVFSRAPVRQTLPWLLLFLALVAIDGLALTTPFYFSLNRAFGLYWNWFGKAFTLVWVAGFALVGPLTLREIGFGKPRPGTLRSAVIVVVTFVLVNAAIIHWIFPQTSIPHPLETLLFQLTMPSLAEEMTYRGVFFALINRAFGQQHDCGPWYRSYAVWITACAFGLLHGFSVDRDAVYFQWSLAIPNAFLFGVIAGAIRQRTGSFWITVCFHSGVNVISPLLSLL